MTASETSTQLPLADRIEHEKVANLYSMLAPGLFATALNAVILAGVQSIVIPGAAPWVWLALMLSITAIRGLVWHNFKAARAEVRHSEKWGKYFRLGALSSGAAWGAAGIILFPAHNTSHEAFMGVVLAGMAAGAAASMFSCSKTYTLFIIPAIAPYAVRCFIEGDTINLAIGVLSIAFMAALLRSAKHSSRMTTQFLELRFANEDLASKMSSIAGELTDSNWNMQMEILEHKKTQEELNKAKHAAEEGARIKSQFLANMSHEIRTPMNGVFGMTDLLMRTSLDDRQKKLVGTINESAKSLLTVINDVLDVSRIEAGMLTIDHAEFNLRDTLDKTIDLFASEANRKGIEFTHFMATGIPSIVKGDSGRIRQIMTNLIGNALKFTKYGEIKVRITRNGGTDQLPVVRFEITDTGIGIDAATKEKLFKPFSQAETSIARRFGGTGLGLSISRHLVSLMNGTVDLESELGKGTKIWFEIPLEAASGTVEESDYELLNGARILIVDDRESNRDIVKSYLEGARVECTCVANTADAWTALEIALESDKPYHAAIVDMVMPDENGIEFTRRLKSDDRFSKIRVILATSVTWQGDLAAIREAGVTSLLTKPVRRHDLMDEAAKAIAGTRHEGWREKNRKDLRVHSGDPLPEIARTRYGAHVLLAEDNPVNVEVANEYLQLLGCTVHVALNGLEAVAQVQSNEFDIILMDCQMPVMDGLTATERIRAREGTSGKRTPIIAVTANAFGEDRMKCYAAGMDDYLSKPYSEDQLEQVLAKWLRKDSEPEIKNIAADSTPAAPAQPAAAKLDPAVLQTMRDSRPELLERLLKIFMTYAPTAVQGLQEAAVRGDFAALKSGGHSLKSSSANVGAKALSDLCRALEASSKEQNLARCEDLVQSIAQEFEALAVEIKAEQSLLQKRASA